MMLNKTFHLLLLSLIPLLGFSQANSQYPDSGNKIRLGFQTTGDGLIWRDTQPNVGVYQPINNKAAWIVLDTVNNKFYHYKNSAWTLAGGQDIDTANLIATKYNLGFKLSLADTANMLTPYWRSGRFSGVLPVANGGTNRTTMPAGYILHGDGTSVDTSIGLFYNRTNNRLGLGTLNPAAPLHISDNGKVGLEIGYVGTTLGDGIELFVYNRATNSRKPISFLASQLYFGDGNSGFGVINPTAKLHVKGSANASEFALKVDDSGSNTLLSVQNNGNVGIGTTSPAAILQVNSATTTPTMAFSQSVSNISTQRGGFVWLNNSNSTVAAVIGQAVTDNVGTDLEFSTRPVGGSLTKVLTLASTGAATFSSSVNIGTSLASGNALTISNSTNSRQFQFGYSTGAGYNYFQVYDGTSFQPLNINNTMHFTSAGNVGIGTTSPTSGVQLQVTGTNARFFLLNNSSGSTSNYSQIAFGNGLNINESAEFYRQNNTKRFHIFNGSGDIFFSTNYVSDFRYDLFIESDNGNVGIGTTSPTARLHVKGSGVDNTTSALKVDNNGNTNLLNILDNGTATFRNISNSGAPATSGTTVNATLSIDNAFSVMTNIGNLSASPYSVWLQVQDKGNLAVTYPLSLQPNGGNVGIGTTSPDYKLNINSSSTYKALMLQANALGTRFDVALEFNVINVRTVPYARIGLQVTSASSNDETGGLTFWTINSGTLSEKMSVAGGGAVTINNLASGTVTSSSGTLSATSDMNLKISDGYIDNALDKIMNLKPRYFYWKEETGLPTNIRQLGFYAQEVNQSLGEEAANTPKNENDKWGIYDRSIIAMLTKAMQEQQSQIDILKQEIINLKNK